MQYNPSLDGLRALAVLAVMAYHARIPGSEGGFLGVDVFFVLSGYLITRLLAEEHERSGTIRFGSFYLRRLRRLYPALLLLLAVYLALSIWLPPQDNHPVFEAVITGLYLSDYSFAFWKTPWLLQHTWSLSVEEHFYLIWPPLLWLVLRLPRHRQLPTIITLATAATIWRWYITLYVDPWQQPYYRFDTRLSGLLFGAAAAVWNPTGSRLMAAMGVVLLAYAGWNAYPKETGALMVWMLLAEIGSVLLILGSVHVRVLAGWPAVWVGRLSYGLYLWHFPILFWLRGQGINGWAALAIGGSAALAGALLSYFTVERLTRPRRRMHHPPQPIASPL